MNKRIWIAAILVAALPLTALADGCQQTDGQWGVYNGTTADDAGCITPDEYQQMFSPENLLATGVITHFTDNKDGTATLYHTIGGVTVVAYNPLDRKVAANPTESDPTVADVLFGWIAVKYGGLE